MFDKLVKAFQPYLFVNAPVYLAVAPHKSAGKRAVKVNKIKKVMHTNQRGKLYQ